MVKGSCRCVLIDYFLSGSQKERPAAAAIIINCFPGKLWAALIEAGGLQGK